MGRGQPVGWPKNPPVQDPRRYRKRSQKAPPPTGRPNNHHNQPGTNRKSFNWWGRKRAGPARGALNPWALKGFNKSLGLGLAWPCLPRPGPGLGWPGNQIRKGGRNLGRNREGLEKGLFHGPGMGPLENGLNLGPQPSRIGRFPWAGPIPLGPATLEERRQRGGNQNPNPPGGALGWQPTPTRKKKPVPV